MNTDTAFRRLRAANPVVHADARDTDALFEQIVASTPDARLSRERPRLRRPVVVLAAFVALAAVLASTAPALSNWVGDVIGNEEVDSEYVQATKQLELPPGYEWPQLDFPSNSVASRGAGGSFAVSIAQVGWECYWADAIARGSRAAQTRARAALAHLMANHVIVAPEGVSENWSPPTDGKPVAVYANDGGFAYKQRTYADAAAGDATLVAQSCRANAPAAWRR